MTWAGPAFVLNQQRQAWKRKENEESGETTATKMPLATCKAKKGRGQFLQATEGVVLYGFPSVYSHLPHLEPPFSS